MVNEKKIIKELNWDSNFFDLKVGELIFDDHEIDWSALYEESRSDNFHLIYIKSKKGIIDFCLPSNSEVKLVDKKITFGIDLKETSIQATNKNISSYPVSESLDQKLIDLSILAGTYSRFKVDTRINVDKFKELYKQWIVNSLNRSFADEVLVYRGQSGEITGMITIQINEGFANIGLLSVDNNQQGKGIGSKLIAAAFSYMTKRKATNAEVVTQLDNKEACNFYQKNGFEAKSLEHIYHLWLR